MFHEFDKDGSGAVSVDEAKSMLRQLGMPDGEVETLVAMYDSNNDGELQYDEFVSFLINSWDGLLVLYVWETKAVLSSSMDVSNARRPYPERKGATPALRRFFSSPVIGETDVTLVTWLAVVVIARLLCSPYVFPGLTCLIMALQDFWQSGALSQYATHQWARGVKQMLV